MEVDSPAQELMQSESKKGKNILFSLESFIFINFIAIFKGVTQQLTEIIIPSFSAWFQFGKVHKIEENVREFGEWKSTFLLR